MLTRIASEFLIACLGIAGLHEFLLGSERIDLMDHPAAPTKAVVEKPHDHRPAASAALEAAGCTLKDYYFALGPADVVVIYEAPDAIRAASVSMTLGASGASSPVETMQLFTMEEAMSAMIKAGQIQKSYKPT
jgi:uncharacterized protein with GYD domain